MSEDDERPFSAEERARLRAILENDERVAWLWASMRVWAGYVSGAVVATYAIYKAVQDWAPHLFKKVGG